MGLCVWTQIQLTVILVTESNMKCGFKDISVGIENIPHFLSIDARLHTVCAIPIFETLSLKEVGIR